MTSGIGNIVVDYLIDLGRFQAELALSVDREDLAERVFARCEALVETLNLEMEYKRASEPTKGTNLDGTQSRSL